MSSGDTKREKRFLPRRRDHLGSLATDLEGMQGYDTLVRELLQNADDVAGASYISFHVDDEALTVDNDAPFRVCSDIEANDCPLPEETGSARMCDFHGIGLIASGNKTTEADTTGKFGIGFTSVYLVTDHPEVISAGYHMRFDETQSEGKRITYWTVEDHSALPPTRFILPWAFDATSYLRVNLRCSAVEPDVANVFHNVLRDTVATSMLFLRRLNRVDVYKHGKLSLRYIRTRSEREVQIVEELDQHEWCFHILEGKVGTPDGFPDKNKEIRVAVGDVRQSDGLLYACLPTHHLTGIPAHVDADFFPSSNRKEILFEETPRGRWNRDIIWSAADCISANIVRIRDELGHRKLWELISSALRVYESARGNRSHGVFKALWTKLKQTAPSRPVAHTTKHQWVSPREVRVPSHDMEEQALGVVSDLGITLLHPELLPHLNSVKELGAKPFALVDLVLALKRVGLTGHKSITDLPAYLQQDGGLTAVRNEIKRQLRAPHAKSKAKSAGLTEVALAPVSDEVLAPLGKAFIADSTVQRLFRSIQPSACFLAIEEQEELEHFWAKTCPRFELDDAVEILESVQGDPLSDRWKQGTFSLAQLFVYLSDELQKHPQKKTADRIASLNIFPVGKVLKALSGAAMPGGFVDPIGLAEVFDVEVLGEGVHLLTELGAKQLTFVDYVTTYLPKAFDEQELSAGVIRAVVRQLANNLSDIESSNAAFESLSQLELVECEDGVFRRPEDVYLNRPEIRECLGDRVHYALVPVEQQAALEALYVQLDVADRPRSVDVLDAIEDLTTDAPTEQSVLSITAVFRFLSRLPADDLGDYDALRTDSWLPAAGDLERWYKPNDIYASYRRYLFESNGRFLPFGREIEDAAATLREFLGVQTEPSAEQIVDHLLFSARHQQPVSPEVYKHLNQKYSEHDTVKRLRRTPCIWIEEREEYVLPTHVFWDSNRYPGYRYKLGDRFKPLAPLFDKLGVRPRPGPMDALEVLKEVCGKHGQAEEELADDDIRIIKYCWSELEATPSDDDSDDAGLVSDSLSELESFRCIVTRDNGLQAPCYMLFEDRPELAKHFGERLKNTIITRPLQGGHAMEIAGVHDLSAVAHPRLHDSPKLNDDGTVHRRVVERHRELARVFASTVGAEQARTALDKIAALGFQPMRRLQVQFQIDHNGMRIKSGVVPVSAALLADEDCIYYRAKGGEPVWTAIAREIASHICRGRGAAELSYALGTTTTEAACEALDQLGIEAIDIDYAEDQPEEADAVEMGEIDNSDVYEQPEEDDVQPKVDDHTGTEVSPNLDAAVEDGATSSLESEFERLLGKQPPTSIDRSEVGGGDRRIDASSTSNATNGAVRSESEPRSREGGKRVSPRSRRRGKRRARQPMLSFIDPEPPNETDVVDTEGSQRKHEIGKAGEDFAVQWERRRAPENQVHALGGNHEGYDVLSEGPGGARRIEVKSCVAEWSETVVRVTAAQFRDAVLGETVKSEWWLYIVEYAEDPKRQRLTPIRNPFFVASRFRFDQGWRNAADRGQSEPSVQGPQVGEIYTTDAGDVVTITSAERKGELWQVKWRTEDGREGRGAWRPSWVRKD